MARILIVDDDTDSREVICKHLENSGHAVDCVSNGRDALSHLLENLPDLLILDLFMPQMDGCSLLEVIRSYLRIQSLPVIVLTGLSDSPMVDRVRNLKVNTILLKAKATLEEIAEAVRQELPRMPH